MATIEQTSIFNPDFNIEWSFGYAKRAPHVNDRGTATRERQFSNYSNTILDRLVDQLERKDTPLVRAICYGFCSVGFMYLAGHLVWAVFN